MELNDILGLGKVLPLDKLLIVLEKGVGRVTKSYFERKDIENKALEIRSLASARADEIKIINEAIAESSRLVSSVQYKDKQVTIGSTPDTRLKAFASIEERSDERIKYQTLKGQINLENIVNVAAQELENEPPVTDESLNEDWTTRFFRIAEDISTDSMQALWGKILANEIKTPRTFSIRTLEILKSITNEEAQVFTKAANLAIHNENKPFLFRHRDVSIFLTNYGLSFDDRLLLIELGLIVPGIDTNRTMYESKTEMINLFEYAGMIFRTIKPANTPAFNIPIIRFSKAGEELLQLINPVPSNDYMHDFTTWIKDSNIQIQFANILNKNGTDYTLSKWEVFG
jgi:uncharacterized repeat protein (TIGR03899 family)